MRAIEYDESNFKKLYAALDPKQQMKALRRVLRREANKVRKTALNNLRSSIRSDKDLERGVRAIVYRKKVGFRVTVGTKAANRKGKGERGYHKNRQGLKKPVLIWAEDGTTYRRTRFRIGRAAHTTGYMKRYGFMAKAANQMGDTVKEVINSISKIAKRYGCT